MQTMPAVFPAISKRMMQKGDLSAYRWMPENIFLAFFNHCSASLFLTTRPATPLFSF
ncbi:MAG TPA: hypothetical protein PKW33_10605 [Anaerolineaceae bacterium]|nr:hypothetical protein [Anaerolineaceae bacterium]HPN52028.1 hypothetical protein [Anaerolineaceae bacterium]